MGLMSTSLAHAHAVQDYVDRLRQYRPMLVQRYGVATVGLFGSYVRNEQRHDSDLDLLVTFQQTPSLFTLVALQDELSALLGVAVDVVMPSSLKPHIGARILAEVVPI
jgi:predicted nucleotidyltransferase